jgi:hypothetical protein
VKLAIVPLKPMQTRRRLALPLLTMLLVIVILLAVGIGAVQINPEQVLAILLKKSASKSRSCLRRGRNRS